MKQHFLSRGKTQHTISHTSTASFECIKLFCTQTEHPLLHSVRLYWRIMSHFVVIGQLIGQVAFLPRDLLSLKTTTCLLLYNLPQQTLKKMLYCLDQVLRFKFKNPAKVQKVKNSLPPTQITKLKQLPEGNQEPFFPFARELNWLNKSHWKLQKNLTKESKTEQITHLFPCLYKNVGQSTAHNFRLCADSNSSTMHNQHN